MSKKIILTGATGMVGRAVLIECLESDQISEVLSLSRNSVELKHPKLREFLHPDFTDFSSIADQLQGYDAFFHCMGVSSVGMDEEKYHRLTYGVAEALITALGLSAKNMLATYVSGQGTDSSEKGRVMWARVKGKTENLFFEKFDRAFAFRIGGLFPEKGVRSKTGWVNFLYTILRPFGGLIKLSKSIVATSLLGKSMILLLSRSPEKTKLENRDINAFVRQSQA